MPRVLSIDEAETREGTGWRRVTVEEALAARNADYRCPRCHGPVQPHKEGTTAQRAHFEHKQKHAGCPLKPGTFSGTESPHPHALT